MFVPAQIIIEVSIPLIKLINLGEDTIDFILVQAL